MVLVPEMLRQMMLSLWNRELEFSGRLVGEGGCVRKSVTCTETSQVMETQPYPLGNCYNNNLHNI